ncbi:hypothetical protein WJX81_002165 [Elliptochloris bilobata]|uniref:EamA domain-containing protein n=1 Tax=Elliptochloris bilobata TaxID=381761 RepID=A0AAW1RNB8_9CHLO
MVVLCATNMVVIKYSEAHFDASAFSLGRFCIAALAFAPFLSEGLADKALWAPAAELGLWMGLGYLTQAQGLLTVDASRAAFISTLTVVVVPILAGLTGKGVRALTWASALGAVLGCALLGTGGGSGFGTGDLLSVLSAVFFGIQVFRTEHVAHKLKPGKQLPLMALTLSSVAAVMLVSAAFVHPAEVQRILSAPASFGAALRDQGVPWWQMLYTGVLSTDAVLLIEVFALNDVPSTDAAIIYSMEPVLGAGLAWAVLGERWGPLGWLGAGIILTSSLAAQIFGSSCAEKSS